MIRERNLEVNMIGYLVFIVYQPTKSFFLLYNFQVSSSYNESKEEITLDEVREKFFQLCGQNAVAVNEPSNNRID